MLAFITVLLLCQLIGEVISKGLGLPLPGPVIGMAILFLGLTVRGSVPEGLQQVAGGLLQHLSLLFVPAGVGVILHVSLIGEEWLPLTVALIGSSVITIAVTALIMRLLSKRLDGKGLEEGGLDDA